ncbi:MAG: hypothetical protein WDO68_22030 [Gammaproteobacteria bacterium]
MFSDTEVGGSYTELLNTASNGDLDAAFNLYMKLGACCQVPGDESEFAAHLAKIRKMEHVDDIDGIRVIRPDSPQDTRRAVEAAISFAMRAREFRLSVPEKQLARDERVQWLNRAAEGGHLRARAQVLLQKSSFGDSQFTPDTIDGRTKEFVQSLGSAALDGHVESLIVMSNLYLGGRVVERDVAKSYAYFAVARFIQYGEEVDPTAWEARNSMHPLAKFARLTPVEVERAESIRKDVISRIRK